MSKALCFFFPFNLKDFWHQTWESLNVNVTPQNSCNHGSLHLWLQSLELWLGLDISLIVTPGLGNQYYLPRLGRIHVFWWVFWRSSSFFLWYTAQRPLMEVTQAGFGVRSLLVLSWCWNGGLMQTFRLPWPCLGLKWLTVSAECGRLFQSTSVCGRKEFL